MRMSFFNSIVTDWFVRVLKKLYEKTLVRLDAVWRLMLMRSHT